MSRIDRFSAPSLGRALGRGAPRPSLLFPLHHPHDPLLRQVTAWIAYPLGEIVPNVSKLDPPATITWLGKHRSQLSWNAEEGRYEL